jgi:hypothetical protein
MADVSLFEPAALLLIATVATIGVLHTVVPDHWVPITLMARQRGWDRAETARVALRAGAGHVLSTLAIALVVWFAGVAAAERFGRVVDLAASVALLAFGGWVAVSASRELRRTRYRHSHPRGHLHRTLNATPHRHRHRHAPRRAMLNEDLHSPEILEIDDHEHDSLADSVGNERYGHAHDHDKADFGSDQRAPNEDRLYAPLAVDIAVRHRHVHRHSRHASPHSHWHDHIAEDAHQIDRVRLADAPLHQHLHKVTGRTALLLILGSSPMVEGIPAFFAAVRFGFWLVIAMSIVFAVTTIATYVLLCVCSMAGLQRVRLGWLERYGEVLSGAFIAGLGVASFIWPAI